jgi:ectoine hydroxylase-related dioxygenase (phytanoyl-CoA dioxygenase family)
MQFDYSLSDDSIQYFQENGHVFLPKIISKDVLQPYRNAILSWADDFRKQQKPFQERDTYGKAFLQMMNLWEENDLVKEFSLCKSFGKIAADLLGVKSVRLYHDQALFKEPGGGHTPWHQDQYYWPIDTSKTITMWMPLVDIEEGMGMLTFASKTHQSEMPAMKISDESEDFIRSYVQKNQFPIVAQKTMSAGDATFHYGWTMHSAPGNDSNTMREVMTLIFMDADARVIQPQNDNQEADRKRWLCSLPAGSLADSKLNPIVY